MKVLQTSRLALRLITLGDLENIHRLLYADPEVAVPWVGGVRSLADVSAPNGILSRVARESDEPGFLAIERAADYALVGIGGILPIRRAGDRARFAPPDPADAPGGVEGRAEGEFDIALGRAHWNRGYAAEAAGPLLALGFGPLGCQRIVTSVDGANERAVKMLRRLGFRIERNTAADPARGMAAAGLMGILDAPTR